ncbi:hypothetical protein [Bacteroides sp.]|uniref:hypothetical protein n=1 Tax=Bacteroides sp. TaxID=29523 RepID=UPI0025C05814|nr:hypothetical protein [Bacteroides sp.]
MTRIKLKFVIVGKNWDPIEFSLLFENIVQKNIYITKDGDNITWGYTEGYVETFDSGLVISSFLNTMEKSVSIINIWCNNKQLKAEVKIQAEATMDLMPAFYVSNRMIHFLNSSRSSINFNVSIINKKGYNK